MNAPLLFAPPGEVRAAAGLVEAVASWDECVLLLGATGAETVTVGAVLDRAIPDLSARRVRCVRVRAPASGGLALRGLMAQVVGRDDPNALTDEDLEAGFAVLTEPGDGYDRVALMVEDAQALLPPAVRYIQLACRSGPLLRVVLAGQPGLEAVLVGEEFADLRRRFTRRLVLPGPGTNGAASDGASPDERPGLFSAAPLPPLDVPEAPGVFVRVRDAAWTLTKLALAASLVVWMVRLGSPQPPPAPPRQPLADSADPSEAPAAAPPAVAPPAAAPPAAAPPRAGSGAPLAVWTTRWEDVPAPPAVASPDPGGRAAPSGAALAPAGREAPAALAPMLPPTVADPVVPPAGHLSSAVPPPVAPSPATPLPVAPLPDTVPPVVSPPAAADVPSPAEAETAARGHAEPSPPPPVSAFAPEPTPPAVGDTPPERGAPSAEREGGADAPRERSQPPADRDTATAAVPDAPETTARDAGHAAARSPEPAPAPLAPVSPVPVLPAPVSPAPVPPASELHPPEPATAALPLPPVPPAQLPPQPPPRAAGASAEGRPAAPPPEAPNAPRRARAGTERAPVAAAPAIATPTPTARADERRCRDLVLKAQLGETLSDAEKQFLRGGCRAD